MILAAAHDPQNVSQQSRKPGKDLRVKPAHPIDIIWAELSARGWTVKTLAARIPGDSLVTRALLFHYLSHPTRELELGPIWAAKLDDAFGLGADFFLSLEKAWRAHQRERAAERLASRVH